MSAEPDLETFARLQAQLRRPFAERDEVLRSAGLDEAAFRTAQAQWSKRLADKDAGALRQRYRTAFASPHEPAPVELAEAPVVQPAASEDASAASGSSPPHPGGMPPDKKFVPSYMLSSNAPAPAVSRPVVPPPVSVPVPLPPPARIVATAPATDFVASTEPLDLERLRSILLADPTPFLGRTTPERLQEIRAEAAAIAEATVVDPSASPGRAQPEPDETAMYVPSPADRAEVGALPFAAKPDAVSFPDLPVDRYAALAAEIQVKGATSAILARYEVSSPAALQALHAVHDHRFAADPALRARFEERRAHFLKFLQQAPRR